MKKPWFSAADARAHRRRGGPPAPRPAAGLLLHWTDDKGGDWWLLGKRHRDLGGGWSNLGGSLERGEHPLLGAFRELHEETLIPVQALRGATISHVVECGTAARPYTMFVLEVPNRFRSATLNWEHTDIAWWLTGDVDLMGEKGRLHPPFADSWTALRPKVAS
jgi:8-oxo-dGTP pyrophosphatase MutT (NUDIX family)